MANQNNQNKYFYSYRGVIMSVSKATIFVVYISMYILTVLLGYPQVDFNLEGYIVLYLLYAIMLTLFSKIYRPFWVGEQRIREMWFANALTICFVNILVYGYLSLIGLVRLPVLPMLLLIITQILAGSLFILLEVRLFYYLFPPVSAIFIYADETERLEMLGRFQYEKARFHIEDQISQEADPKEIFRAVDAYKSIIAGAISMELRDQLMRYSFDNKKEFFLIQTIADIKIHFSNEISVYDTQLLRSKAHGFSMGLRIAKRAMDVIGATVGLLVFGLPILVCALIVRLQDGGNPFFRQERLTRDGAVFSLVKLRSMIVNAEEETGAVISSGSDARVTKFGKFLRVSHIDELPQLWNVLKGDLSLVGPRPERPELHVNICTDYPEFRYRLLVKAGLTGYAQVYGRYNTPPHQKLRMDMRYIETASIGLDFKILLYTLMKVFVRESRIEENAEVAAKHKDGGKKAAA